MVCLFSFLFFYACWRESEFEIHFPFKFTGLLRTVGRAAVRRTDVLPERDDGGQRQEAAGARDPTASARGRVLRMGRGDEPIYDALGF